MTTSTLEDVSVGAHVLVHRITADARRVDKLAALGILPGIELRIVQTRPVFIVECGETVLALERELAAMISVSLAPQPPPAELKRTLTRSVSG